MLALTGVANAGELKLRVAPATAANRARFMAGDDPLPSRSTWPTSAPRDRDALAALGADAFAQFPVGIEDAWSLHIDDDDALRRAGVTLSDDGEALGLLFVEARGEWRVGYGCMLCHARREGGVVRVGRANDRLAFGDVLASAFPSDARAPAWRRWGSGRVDVTDDDIDDPLRVPDLVALDELRYLQQSGAVQADATTRITQVLGRSPLSHAADRTLAVAIAGWLRTLAAPRAPEGAPPAAFVATCVRCHDGPALGGRRLIDASIVGTDERAAHDGLRGTGAYRVAPLLGVGSRTRFFHDGALQRLADVIDPRRFGGDYRGGALGPGPVRGHPWGTTLSEIDRAAIVAFLLSSR